MGYEIIYEEKHSHIGNVIWEDTSKVSFQSDKEQSAFAKLLLQIPHQLSFAPSPQRSAIAAGFIRRAKDYALIYGFDVCIEKSEWGVRVTYAFDSTRMDCSLSDLFGIADRVSFFPDRNDRKITIVLEYLLYEVMRNGIATLK